MKQEPVAINANYKVFAENLAFAFERANKQLPEGFKFDWLKVVDALDWAASMHEMVKLASPGFANYYMLFEFNGSGQIILTLFENKREKYNTVVACTIVADFLDAVDGKDDDIMEIPV